jgi:hypothetical protein
MHTISDRLNDDKRLLLLVSQKIGQRWNIKDVFVRVQRSAKYVLILFLLLQSYSFPT